MSQPYRLFGAELSPSSVKVRQVLKFKQLDFTWRPRTAEAQEEFRRYAKAPILPILVDAEENALQDSTATLETLERRHPEPGVTPDDPALAFVSELLEDYADEWLNKAVFHYRWSFEADQIQAGHRIAETMLDGKEIDDRPALEAGIRERMIARRHHVGAGEANAAVIEGAYVRLLDLLEAHLKSRPYLFGARPALADFGLAAQLAQLGADPTPSSIMNARAMHVAAWVARMELPSVEGPFEDLAALETTLTALLREEVAPAYLAWMEANAAAANSGERVACALPGGDFDQAPQRYAAKAFMEIRKKRAMLADDADLARLLGETGCDVYLQPPASALGMDEAEEPVAAMAEDDEVPARMLNEPEEVEASPMAVEEVGAVADGADEERADEAEEPDDDEAR